MNQTDLDHRLARVRGPLVVPAVPPVPTEPRASAHFLVDGKRVYGIRQKPKKGSDLRRQYEATVGKSGKHCASRAVPKSPGKPSDSPLFVEGLSRSPLMLTVKCALALLWPGPWAWTASPPATRSTPCSARSPPGTSSRWTASTGPTSMRRPDSIEV